MSEDKNIVVNRCADCPFFLQTRLSVMHYDCLLSDKVTDEHLKIIKRTSIAINCPLKSGPVTVGVAE